MKQTFRPEQQTPRRERLAGCPCQAKTLGFSQVQGVLWMCLSRSLA